MWRAAFPAGTKGWIWHIRKRHLAMRVLSHRFWALVPRTRRNRHSRKVRQKAEAKKGPQNRLSRVEDEVEGRAKTAGQLAAAGRAKFTPAAAKKRERNCEGYSETRVTISRNHCTQADATNRERRPSTNINRPHQLWFRSDCASRTGACFINPLLCQGTTSIVPKRPEKRRVLTPEE
jgi:hypothetical protein